MKLPHRAIVLLSIIQELDNFISDDTIHKYLFMYCNKYACNNSYDFIWINNSPYCITLYEDKKLLINKQILQNSSGWTTYPEALRFAKKLDMLEKFSLQKLKNDIEKNILQDETIKQAYNNYCKIDVVDDRLAFYTIGYESSNLEQYLNKLLKYQINYLCDVRYNPYSQKYGFSRTELQYALSLINIQYIHIPKLGISSSLRQDLRTDMDYYNLLKQYESNFLPKQEESIELLEKLLIDNRRIAITCFEVKVSHCHRSKIANIMSKRNNVECIIAHI